MRSALLVALLAASIALSGCFGGDDDDGHCDDAHVDEHCPPPTHTPATPGDGGNPPEEPTVPENGTGDARAPVTWDVEVRDDSFEPAELTIQVGDTVRWTHAGSNPHTVTSDDDGQMFDSHPDCNPTVPLVNCMASEDTFEYTFDAVGTFDYVCKVHAPSMAGSVTVMTRYDEVPEA